MALYTLAPQPWLIFLDDHGLYIPNGQLAIYQAGTTTPATTYTSAMGTAHPFPITLDGTGRIPGGLYLQPGLSYKFVLHAPLIEEPLDGAIIKTQDDVSATPNAGGSILTLATPGDHVALNVAGVNIIEYTGAGDATIRGMVGGVLGQSILIRNITASAVFLSPNDLTAPAGARLLNFVVFGMTPMLGGRSSARYTYASTGFWTMDTHAQGTPITPPFSAANYGGNGAMTWTVEAGDVNHESFYVNGRSLLYTFHIFNTTVGGTVNTALTRLLPYGWAIFGTRNLSAIVVSTDTVSFPQGWATIIDATHVGFQRVPLGTAWVAGTNLTTVSGQLELILN